MGFVNVDNRVVRNGIFGNSLILFSSNQFEWISKKYFNKALTIYNQKTSKATSIGFVFYLKVNTSNLQCLLRGFIIPYIEIVFYLSKTKHFFVVGFFSFPSFLFVILMN